jgi:8-oxo-dGTP pyrophosphatase MutT (NUDIX family)
MKLQTIRPIAICIFKKDNRILVSEGFDSVKGTSFYRPLGGGIEPGETSQEAVRREIFEEMGLAIEELQLLGVLENIFSFEANPGHEIVFVYNAVFVDETVYDQHTIIAKEDNGEALKVLWKDVSTFDSYHQLVPEGLSSLLETTLHKLN